MATIDALVWVEKSELSSRLLKKAKHDLVVVPKPRRTCAVEDVEDEDTGVIEQKKVWRTETFDSIDTLVRRDGKYGIPIDYALNVLGIEPEDNTSVGKSWKPSRLPDPNHPSAPPNQEVFSKEVYSSVVDYESTMACAPTGSGKTVVSLNAAGLLGVTTLVIVPSTILADQWEEETALHLGIPRRFIGRIGGGKENWKDKRVVIAIIHNLFLKTYPAEFYRAFGFVVWDEAHKLGAPMFAKTMTQFPSRYKLAVTATPDRNDGLGKMLWNYFGKPSVEAVAPALHTTVWSCEFDIIGNFKWLERCRNDVRPLKWLASLPKRNELLVKIIKMAYDRGYYIVGMSKFIDHVELIKTMCIEAGIPENDIGQFTRTQGKKKTKVGKGYLDKMKTRRILLGTYAMLKEGFDQPRLDAGIELLPIANNKQGIGRVRRPHKDAKKPVWFTIRDLHVPLFVRYYVSRLRGFRETNVTIKNLKMKP